MKYQSDLFNCSECGRPLKHDLPQIDARRYNNLENSGTVELVMLLDKSADKKHNYLNAWLGT